MQTLKAFWASLKAFWAGLPHIVQAAIVFFSTTTIGGLIHAFSEPNACFSLACLKHVAKTALFAGASATWLLYVRPNLPSFLKPPDPPASPKP